MTDQVRPAYGERSLADVLPGALAVLGVPGAADPLGLAGKLAGIRRVAVLLVDGLGYRQLPLAAAAAPTLADALAGRLGELRSLTAGFPSTTPTSLVTLGTGAPPGAHGVIGFSVHLPGDGQVLNHLRWETEPDPGRWQPLPTRFAQAAAAGVAVTVVHRASYAGSGLTVAAYRGAGFRPAADPDELVTAMLAALTEPDPPALVYGYVPDLDAAGHEYGVDSVPWREASAEVDRLLERLVAGLPEDAALLLTADHGQLNVSPADRFDLDTDRRLSAGVVAVAGDPRVRYARAVPGAADDVVAAWRVVLGPAAWVAPAAEAVAGGWFGPVVAEPHRERLGDVVAVCRDRSVVLATAHESERVTRMVGFHGSWTAAEMLVPLLVVRG